MPVSCQKIPHWPEKKNLKLRARAFGPPPPWQPLDTTWGKFWSTQFTASRQTTAIWSRAH